MNNFRKRFFSLSPFKRDYTPLIDLLKRDLIDISWSIEEQQFLIWTNKKGNKILDDMKKNGLISEEEDNDYI